MNSIKTIGLTLALASAMTFSAHAAQINGAIGFTGLYTQNGGSQGDLTTATSMTINTVNVGIATGDLAGAGAPLSFASPVGVNGNLPSLVGGTLWSVTVGGTAFTFVVTSSAQVLTDPDQINLQGFGTMNDGPGGFDPTPGEWQLGFGVSGTGPTAAFTWQATTAANPTVPDGGSTVALLGLVLAGLGAFRRKILG